MLVAAACLLDPRIGKLGTVVFGKEPIRQTPLIFIDRALMGRAGQWHTHRNGLNAGLVCGRSQDDAIIEISQVIDGLDPR